MKELHIAFIELQIENVYIPINKLKDVLQESNIKYTFTNDLQDRKVNIRIKIISDISPFHLQ